MSSRSEKLAERIEEGARNLAAFVKDLSESDWQTPVTATDRRTVGIVVHHVASMYPIEIEVARAVIAGNPVVDVTCEMVQQINAKHAAENAQPDKTETLELLGRNSHAAADAVRELTDDQLDLAAPLGLSFGAPVTVQFVIEDHALRHSWHHLARIRTTVQQKVSCATN